MWLRPRRGRFSSGQDLDDEAVVQSVDDAVLGVETLQDETAGLVVVFRDGFGGEVELLGFRVVVVFCCSFVGAGEGVLVAFLAAAGVVTELEMVMSGWDGVVRSVT
jgi:hypothetical protein